MRFHRLKRLGVSGTALLTTLAVAVPMTTTASASSNLIVGHSAGATSKYIVFLRSNATNSSRVAQMAARTEQSNVLSTVPNLASHVVARSLVPNTLTVSLTASQARTLALNPSVSSVLPDALIPGPASGRSTIGRTVSSIKSHTASSSCGTAAHPQLNPEALNNINAPGAWSQGATGETVTVAYLAEGTDTTNVDLQRNASYASAGFSAGSPVVRDYQDFSGDGTASAGAGEEAMGDASSIAAQGNTAYDLSHYANGSPAGCDIKVVGVAPGASLLSLDVFSQSGYTTASSFVQAISYAVANNVQVINESFGSNPFPDGSVDVVKLANDAAVAAGVTVVVSSGDAGINSTIGSPASDPNVIAVGASTTFRAYLQSNFGGINSPVASGAFIDNNISSLSSAGFSQNGKTVDLVAPGDLGWAITGHNSIVDFGGTSQSSPLTAGAAADVIQAYESTHFGDSPSPDVVKQILTSTATDIKAPAEQQGAGLLNVAAAVKLASSLPGTTSKARSGVLENTAQLNIVGNPLAKTTTSFTVSNYGKKAVKFKASARQLVAAGSVSGSVTLDPSVGTAQPTFTIWSGAAEVYQTATFNVPVNTDRVKLVSDYQFTNQSSLLHVALFTPTGQFAGYSLPQGVGDYADIEVATPVAGTWTAIFFTVYNGYCSSCQGTSGPVSWNATMWKFTNAGKVSPASFTLGGGSTKTLKFTTTLPGEPGDSSQSIVLDEAGTSHTIPVTIRTMIPSGGGLFHGVLTGGNGRGDFGAVAQTNTYDFVVPAGQHDVVASVALAANDAAGLLSGTQFVADLIGPNGELVASDTNETICSGGPCITNGISLFKAAPRPGLYQLVLNFANPVGGANLVVPMIGEIAFNQVTVTGNVLPHSASSTISATTGASYSITVNNSGVAPLGLYVEGRLSTNAVYTSTKTGPVPGTNLFGYVPTETSSLFGSVTTAATPVTFDLSPAVGDPDISPDSATPYVSGGFSGGNSASLTYAPPSGVGSGVWGLGTSQIGPYGPAGLTPATGTVTLSATTKAFDDSVSAVTSQGLSSGIQECLSGQTSTCGGALVDPGSTITFTVIIQPTAAVGSVVSGTLYINSDSLGGALYNANYGYIMYTQEFQSELAAMPYTYTVAP